ncbi:MAG: hypothetical protein K9M36_02675 [Candidatus Pacebacteria bacterium]|nr:hypothetical protein [Candidatus Paceibacterota bacterium]
MKFEQIKFSPSKGEDIPELTKKLASAHVGEEEAVLVPSDEENPGSFPEYDYGQERHFNRRSTESIITQGEKRALRNNSDIDNAKREERPKGSAKLPPELN